MAEVKVYGAEEFRQLLRRAMHSIDRKEIVNYMREESKPIRDQAIADAQMGVNPTNRTYQVSDRAGGSVKIPPRTIAKSIGIKVLRKTTDPVVIVAPRITSNYKSGWFAHFVHAGTGQRVTKKGKSTGRISNPIRFMDRAGSPATLGAAADRVGRRIIRKLEQIGM